MKSLYSIAANIVIFNIPYINLTAHQAPTRIIQTFFSHNFFLWLYHDSIFPTPSQSSYTCFTAVPVRTRDGQHHGHRACTLPGPCACLIVLAYPSKMHQADSETLVLLDYFPHNFPQFSAPPPSRRATPDRL